MLIFRSKTNFYLKEVDVAKINQAMSSKCQHPGQRKVQQNLKKEYKSNYKNTTIALTTHTKYSNNIYGLCQPS